MVIFVCLCVSSTDNPFTPTLRSFASHNHLPFQWGQCRLSTLLTLFLLFYPPPGLPIISATVLLASLSPSPPPLLSGDPRTQHIHKCLFGHLSFLFFDAFLPMLLVFNLTTHSPNAITASDCNSVSAFHWSV